MLNFRAGSKLWLLPFGAAIISVYLALTTSFRVAPDNLALAVQANLARVLIAFSAGVAFGLSGAISNSERTMFEHVSGYIGLVLGATVWGLGFALGWPSAIVVLITLVASVAAYLLSNRLAQNKPYSNFILASVLALAFVFNVVAFAFASSQSDGVGGVVLWLFGDLSYASDHSLLVISIVFVLAIWLLMSIDKDVPAILLSGVGLGIAGPLFFIGWLAPLVAQRFSDGERMSVFTSGLLGGAVVVAIDAGSKAMVGGYAPPLMIAIALLSLPLVLWSNRARLATMYPSTLRTTFEAISIVLVSAITVFAIFHVALYAQAAT